jgi:hypothetical protein
MTRWPCLLLTAACLQAADIAVTPAGSVLRFSAGGQPVCNYQMQPADVPAGVDPIFRHGAHLHPVFSPSGRCVTGNHQADHPWQRGIWMAWTKTEFGGSHPDFWNMGKTNAKSGGSLAAEVRFVRLVKSWGGMEGGGFVSEHAFLDHSRTPEQKVLNETWEVRVAQETLDGTLTNVIDLTSNQTCATDQPLKLPQYHYGGLGVRGAPEWNAVEAVRMLTSEGHDRKTGDSTRARWVWLGGEIEGATAGIAVLIHPSNFRFPQPLRLNPKNPQLCVAPSQSGDWAIEPRKPHISKYRFLIFDGSANAGWIEAQWRTYSGSN